MSGPGGRLSGSEVRLSGSGRLESGVGPAVRGSGPAVRGSGPAVRGSGPAVRGSGPAVRGSDPEEDPLARRAAISPNSSSLLAAAGAELTDRWGPPHRRSGCEDGCWAGGRESSWGTQDGSSTRL